MRCVFDASAVLAILNNEPGAERARSKIKGAMISTVNAVEVGTRLVDAGMPPDAAEEALRLLRIKVVDFDPALTRIAVELRIATKAQGLSLADRACLALALREQACAVTADRAWRAVSIDCSVELIR